MQPVLMADRQWADEAVRRIEADFQRSSDTHLIPLSMPGFPGIDMYLKDESSHPTGSLKHRLARSLFLYSLCNGWLHRDSTVVEASSGSTAISEAYFARLVGLPFIAVMPTATSREKIAAIEFQGGRCELVDDARAVYQRAEQIARETGGHYMDQFTYAERATDWRANNNITESIYAQMRFEPHPVPRWLVSSAGTGGTVATLGRYARYCRHDTRILCADPERSVFFDHFVARDASLSCDAASRIEGIGRPRVEASFMPDVIDAMVKVPDRWSLGAMRELSTRLGRRVGGSTGTNLVASLVAAQRMKDAGEQGSLVVILCDAGERYRETYFDDGWLAANDLRCERERGLVAGWLDTGEAPEVAHAELARAGLDRAQGR
jgi:cysteine synthase A